MEKKFYRYHDILFCILIFAILLTNSCGGGGGNRSGNLAPGDTTPPTVVSTSPENGATQVPPNVVISATFSEPVVLPTNSFIINKVGGATIAGTISYTDATLSATFQPTVPLDLNTIYNITITTNVEDAGNNKMAEPKVWSFTTGTEFDSVEPSFPNGTGITASAVSSDTISLSWNAATDNSASQNQLRYVICKSTSAADCVNDPFPAQGGNVEIKETTGVTNYTFTGLTTGTTYYFVVRAKDLVNLMDHNTTQSSVKTPGEFVAVGGSLNAVCTTDAAGKKSCNLDASRPSLAAVGGVVYLAWSEGNNIYIRTLDNPVSKIWSAATQLSISAGNTAPFVHITSNGASSPIAYLTYTECDNTGGNCNVFVRKRNGSAWDSVGGTLNSNPTIAPRPSMIAFDGSQTPYVVFLEQDGSGNYQVSVKHFDTGSTSWVQDGTSLNVNLDRFGNTTATTAARPTIAINGTTVKVSWTECVATNASDCHLYVKGWNGTTWTPANPTRLNAAALPSPSQPTDPSLTFVGTDLYVAWTEAAKVYVRKEEANGTFTAVGTIATPIHSSSNTPIGASTTAAPIPYLILPDTSPIQTSSQGPVLYANRWDSATGQWIIEDGGSLANAPLDQSLNMTENGSPDGIRSSLTFLQGTPYVAWVEKGNCLGKTLLVNPCGQEDFNHYQVYVKRLE